MDSTNFSNNRAYLVDTGWTAYGMVEIPINSICVVFAYYNGKAKICILTHHSTGMNIVQVVGDATISIVPYPEKRYIAIREFNQNGSIRALVLSNSPLKKLNN